MTANLDTRIKEYTPEDTVAMNKFVLPHDTRAPMQSWRALRVGNIPRDTTATQLLNLVTTGMVEKIIYPLGSSSSAEIRLMNYSSAVHLYVDWYIRKPHIRGAPLRVSWCFTGPVKATVLKRVTQGATRNVYISRLPASLSSEKLERICQRYGEIESLRVKEKSAIIHFTSIESAIKAVDHLPSKKWRDCEINFGHDRCAHITKTQKHLVSLFLGQKSKDIYMDHAILSNTLAQIATAAMTVGVVSGGPENVGNRTVYLSGLGPRTTLEQLCLVCARGGVVQNVRHNPDRGTALVTFLDPIAAAQFFATWNVQTLVLSDHSVMVSWGERTPLSLDRSASAADSHASRNVFIGSLPPNFDRTEFSRLMHSVGSVAQIHWVDASSCAFANFADMDDALAALKTLRRHERYRNLPVRFAKDRVGTPPNFISYNRKPWNRGPYMIQFLAQCQQTPGIAPEMDLDMTHPSY